jgi:hypothetical protein
LRPTAPLENAARVGKLKVRLLDSARNPIIEDLQSLPHRTSLRVVAAQAAFLVALVVNPGASDGATTAASARTSGATGAVSSAATTTSSFEAASWSAAALGGVSEDVFALALKAAETAVTRGDAVASTLTVIDFSRPSTEERMWVFDLRTRELLYRELVSHGRNSGHNLATAFSNQAESHKSSLGLFRTAEGYVGKHGYSLRLDGLEAGINDRARERAIVIHGADYVNAATAKSQGRLGRSLGCPAVRPAISRALIDAVKGGGLLFAYYPDRAWLTASTYLNN